MKSISVQALKPLLDSNPKLNLLDVRELQERLEFNIGGTHLPLGKIMSFQIDEIEDLKDEEWYVYCRSGMRSLQACIFLEQAGFSKVINIEGGMTAWQAI